MILSRPFLIIFIAISSISFSQESSIEDNKIIEEYTFRTKSYEKKDGYVIKNYHTSLVDNYGTLWVGGTVDKSSVNQFNKEFIGESCRKLLENLKGIGFTDVNYLDV